MTHGDFLLPPLGAGARGDSDGEQGRGRNSDSRHTTVAGKMTHNATSVLVIVPGELAHIPLSDVS